MYYIKNLNNLFELFKPTDRILSAGQVFYEGTDGNSWSNGFIADITNINTQKMKAQAIIKNNELKPLSPKALKKIIPPDGQGEDVEDVNLTLQHKAVKLTGKTLHAFVNPLFLQYFEKSYRATGGIQRIVVVGKTSPVKIYSNEDRLVGLIMPIQVNE